MTDSEEQLPFSHVPGRPTFRGMAVNAVAMVPLLSTDKEGHEIDSHSQKSFVSLFQSLHRFARRDVEEAKSPELDEVDILHSNHSESTLTSPSAVQDLLLVVPNSQLTRPGEWRYDSTPLKNFHWGHGCQRLALFDARPHCNRMAHDRLINPTVVNDWIDILPSRRTAAVIGILNIKDVHSEKDLQRAQHELSQWAQRYSAPPYEVTFHGRSFARDEVVSRLFVFDSFEDSCREIDLSKTKLGSGLVAFPPSDSEHYQMMDLHLNVVVNDLAVAIFQQLEQKIKESDALCKEKGGAPDARVKTHSLLKVDTKNTTDEPLSKGDTLSVANIANIVSPGNRLAAASNASASQKSKTNPIKNVISAMHNVPNRRHTPTPQLLTPLDNVWDLSELNPRDAQAMKKRDMARREKYAADLSMLAGSPMDAYERYSRAAEMCKTTPDPLWYAAALEGCAAAHIAMAEAGGYNVDSYLDNNFVLPEEFMTCASNSTYTQDSRKQPSKQTLPSVVFALCEEALHISNRHPKLAPLHAELLLKLAAYVANDDEAHLRCRWGEGEGCYGGDASDPRRWDRTTVSQLAFQELKGKEGEDLILASTAARCKMFTRLLHRAASTGGLAPLTRADVAATCTRLCLRGLVPTQWKNRPKTERLPLFRKAAFFATVAAESISQCSDMEATLQASGLWLTASQFYSRSSNADGTLNYGWATLRASSLYALSQQEDKLSSEAASEMLLALLSDMAPDEIPKEKNDLRASLKALDAALQFDDPPMSGNSRHSTDGSVNRSEDDSVSLSSRYSSYQSSSRTSQTKSLSLRGNFFPQQPTATASLLTVAQAKWADDDPIPQIDLPLPGVLQKGGSLSLNCVIPKISAQRCAAAQRGCIGHISDLRSDLPTISSSSTDNRDPQYAVSLSESPENGEPIVPPPLVIVSAAVVPSESHMLLERFKAGSKSGKGGSMATFYNPYDTDKEADKKIVTTLVAAGEERELTIEFNNLLSVPLDIPSCQVVFDCENVERIKAPALSFVIPPKAKKFAVQFPFLVLDSQSIDDGEEDSIGGADEPPPADMVDVKGIQVTCLSRSYFLSLEKHQEAEYHQVPDPASVYQRRVQYDSARHEEMIKPRLELLPAQPQLHLKFAASETEVVDNMDVMVRLSDGETYTLPSFRMNNDFGPTGEGAIERLQIIGVGLPGLSEDILFDTDTPVDVDSEKDVFFESIDEDSEKSMDTAPLKIKVLAEDLTLASINHKSNGQGQGNDVKFQMVASHDLGAHGDKIGNVRLRFRYRGASVDPAAEIWRKTEVHLKIDRVKGPRISSLAFRPDLNWASAYAELSEAFAKQIDDYNALKLEWKMSSDDDDDKGERDTKVNIDTPVFARIGLDAGVHVASGDVALVMTVTNETDSTIVLSNRKGLVGGFDVSPMPTLKIASGVSAKVPVVVPRIKRIDDDGNTTDVVGELVSQLGLQWETATDESGANEVKSSNKLRQGRIYIPASCLREIVNDHLSFGSRIGEPPVSMTVNVGHKQSEKTMLCSPGTPVDVFVEAKTAEWVPKEVAAKCRITLEFCAARKQKRTERGAFIWCGLVRRTLQLDDTEKSHRARVLFLKSGEYVVSACARLVNEDGTGTEETWMAPLAETIVVESGDTAAQ